MTRAPGRGLDAAWLRSPQVVGRRVGAQYVLVPLAGGGADLDGVLNLNAVAAFVWERLDGRSTGRQVVDEVLERFEVTRERAEQDYLELVDTLAGRGAIAPSLTGVPREG